MPGGYFQERKTFSVLEINAKGGVAPKQPWGRRAGTAGECAHPRLHPNSTLVRKRGDTTHVPMRLRASRSRTRRGLQPGLRNAARLHSLTRFTARQRDAHPHCVKSLSNAARKAAESGQAEQQWQTQRRQAGNNVTKSAIMKFRQLIKNE